MSLNYILETKLSLSSKMTYNEVKDTVVDYNAVKSEKEKALDKC